MHLVHLIDEELIFPIWDKTHYWDSRERERDSPKIQGCPRKFGAVGCLSQMPLSLLPAKVLNAAFTYSSVEITAYI